MPRYKIRTKEERARAKKLREESGLSWLELSDRTGIPQSTLKTWSANDGWKDPPLKELAQSFTPTDPKVVKIEQQERLINQLRADKARQKALYKVLQGHHGELEKMLGISEQIGNPRMLPIQKNKASNTTVATMLALASDWHIEEEVRPEAVGGLNEYNLSISERRAKKFFSSLVRLWGILRKDVKVEHLILALLGDFLSNTLHEDQIENLLLPPTESIVRCQDYIYSGINFVLENTDLTLNIPCHSGNHARTTKRVHNQKEYGHSLEWLMFMSLAKIFESEPRVNFTIPKSYHSYQTVYGVECRFHHGHNIRYQGGVGGITIPVNKAIAQWNYNKPVHLDLFGHFHQLFDGGNFICNGSLIGHSAFSVAFKFKYERPQQSLSLIDSTHGRTCHWPILV